MSEQVNPYKDHPGFDADDCYMRYTVTKQDPYGGIVYCGFGCDLTGGHCLPGPECDDRRAKGREQDAIRLQFFQRN